MLRIVCVLVSLVAAAGTSRGEYVMTITQVGSDVVASGSGTFDLAGLTFFQTVSTIGIGPGAIPNIAYVDVGIQGTTDVYQGFSGPSAFGPGTGASPDSLSGDFTTLLAAGSDIGLPTGYASGTMLAGSATFDNSTLSSLGLTPGTYTWTWGQGADADSFVLNIEMAATAAPEPASLTLVGIGAAGLAGYGWRRRA